MSYPTLLQTGHCRGLASSKPLLSWGEINPMSGTEDRESGLGEDEKGHHYLRGYGIDPHTLDVAALAGDA